MLSTLAWDRDLTPFRLYRAIQQLRDTAPGGHVPDEIEEVLQTGEAFAHDLAEIRNLPEATK